MLAASSTARRYTVGVALAATVLAVAVGGAARHAGRGLGGWFDAALSRALDALISIPSKMFGLVVVAAFGSSVPVLIAVAAHDLHAGRLPDLPLARRQRQRDGLRAGRAGARREARATSCGREILPNIIGPVLADFGLRFVFMRAAADQPQLPRPRRAAADADWGSLVRENIGGAARRAAPAVIMPAVAIATLTIGVNLLIDNLPGHTGDRPGDTLMGATVLVNELRVVGAGRRRRAKPPSSRTSASRSSPARWWR